MEEREATPAPEAYREAAALRLALRAFQRRTDEITAAHGLTTRRYVVLLAVKTAGDGRERATITELADLLLLAQNTVTEVVDRMVGAGLVTREGTAEDRRLAYVRLTGDGERRLAACVRDLRSEREHLRELLLRLEPGL